MSHQFLASGIRSTIEYRRLNCERGLFALNFAGLLVVLLGFCALALELGLVYNRKEELHGVANATAMAAARELNGTEAGIDAALASAALTAQAFRYRYGTTVPWSNAAISFSTAPSGALWLDASTARSAPAGLYYASVTAGPLLGHGVGTVETPFFGMLPNSSSSATVTDGAIAGRTSINITPLAICAMSPIPRAPRINDGLAAKELVEYGFRRGVGYDLMKLNPANTTGITYVVDPVFQPGASGVSSNTAASRVAPFVCAGSLWMPRVTGGQIRVTEGFPLGQLFMQLNSRFDKFQGTTCSANGAPPDFNVKAFDVTDTASVGWMTPRPSVQAALTTVTGGKSETILDYQDPTPPGQSADYGPLWSYSKAARYTATVPTGGETFFATTDWPHLYPGAPTNSASNEPYRASSGPYYGRPALANLPIAKEERRVLNIPLLSCPVSGSGVPATVLAVGRFFMTVPATSTSIYAEFAGIATEQSLTGQAELY